MTRKSQLDIAALEWLSDDYYRLSEHYALMRRYDSNMTREDYIACMERHIIAGRIALHSGDCNAPVETTLSALGGLDAMLVDTTLLDSSPLVSITAAGEAYLDLE